ncbi:hypothetical protein R1flu_010110 [Riccia fluitans]|uniref:Uncharacterized protein n=1 Tax=Riccia fluitans TaxID=41844 RepID=A0ABD1Z423_9MARC
MSFVRARVKILPTWLAKPVIEGRSGKEPWRDDDSENQWRPPAERRRKDGNRPGSSKDAEGDERQHETTGSDRHGRNSTNRHKRLCTVTKPSVIPHIEGLEPTKESDNCNWLRTEELTRKDADHRLGRASQPPTCRRNAMTAGHSTHRRSKSRTAKNMSGTEQTWRTEACGMQT